MANRLIAVRAGEKPEVLAPSEEELPALLEDPDVFVWVNLDNQGEQSHRILRDIFSFHPLLVEDAFADASTPKVESYGHYLYLIIHGLSDSDPEGDGRVQTSDLDLFLGERYLITHYRVEFDAVKRVLKAVDTDPSLLVQGPAVIAHRIIDRLVDEFLPLMEKLDAEVDSIEERILADSAPTLLEHIFRLKHSIHRIRRVGLHQRRIIEQLARGDFPLIPIEVRPFYRDVYDHMVRVTDLNEVYRELIGSSLDAYLSMQSHKLNGVMRVLTVFSTVMLPLTFVTSLYGMNFDYMPGLHWKYAYEAAWAVMLLIAVGMLTFFKRRGWF